MPYAFCGLVKGERLIGANRWPPVRLHQLLVARLEVDHQHRTRWQVGDALDEGFGRVVVGPRGQIRRRHRPIQPRLVGHERQDAGNLTPEGDCLPAEITDEQRLDTEWVAAQCQSC